MYQPREFTGMTKPERFPYFKKPLPNKKFTMFASDEQQQLYESKKFNQILSQNLDSTGNKSLTNTQKVQLAINQMTMMMVSIQQGFDSLPLHLLANMELQDSGNNFEKVHDKNYASYASALQGSMIQAKTKYEEAKRKKSIEIDEEEDDTDEAEVGEKTPAKGSTYIHNANLYKGFSTDNPFKEQDESYDVYEENPLFAMQKDGFMNTQDIRGTELKAKIDEITEKHQASLPVLENVVDPYTDTKIETFTIKGNLHTLLTNPQLRTNWEGADFHAHLISRWSDQKNVSKVVRSVGGRSYSQFEAISRAQYAQKIQSDEEEFNAYIGQLDFAINSLNTLKEELKNASEEDAEDLALQLLGSDFNDTSQILEIEKQIDDLVTLLDPDSANLSDDQKEVLNERIDQSTNLVSRAEKEDEIDLSYANEVLEKVNKKLPDAGMFLPYSVFVELAGEMMSYMNLGFWGQSDHELAQFVGPEDDGFIAQSINGYMQIESDNLTRGMYANEPVQPNKLAIDNVQYGEALFKELQKVGLLDLTGHVTDKFNEKMTIVSDRKENERIIGVLREAKQGNFNFEKLDHTMVNGKKRRNMEITDPTGNNFSLMALGDVLKQEGTAQERYNSIRDTYNVLFDMFETMTGAGLETEGISNQTRIKETTDGTYKMEMYPNSTWEEWNEFHHQELDENGEAYWVPGWDKVEGEPLTLEFQTKSEAEAYYTRIREMLSTLEPIVGTFSPRESTEAVSASGWSYQNGEPTEVGLRVLNDNVGMMGDNGIIDTNSPSYKLEVDYMYNQAFFQTDHWKGVTRHVVGETNLSIGKELFQVSIGNRIVKMRHTRRKEEYKEKKKEHMENEYVRIKNELKQYFKRVAEEKRNRKEYFKKVSKRLKELKAQEDKARKRSLEASQKRKAENAKRKRSKR